MSEVVCKLEDDLCRCCHSEGAYKNLTGVYNFGGIEEIYYDMLRDTFDINLNPMPGLLCVSTYTICDACIEKLRDATNFKKQVLFYEDKFKEMISKNLIRGAESDDVLEIKQEETDEVFSRIPGNRVKVKKRSVSTALSDHNDDDDWHCDDELLDEDHKGQSEVPKKKSKRAQSKTKGRSKKDLNKKKKIKMESSAENKDNAEGGIIAASSKFRVRADDYTRDGTTIVCTHCGNRYNKYCTFRYHVKTKHYKIPKFKCPRCPESFMTPATFTVHKLREHNIDDRINCNACKGVFNSKIQLRKHMDNFHMMGEKYKCDFCDYESFSFEGMYKHKFKHKTERDYHCRFCKKSFLRRATLSLHERIHTGDRRKVCTVCGQAFVQKASLNYHMTKYHPEVNF
ncbi:zinc finger and SCAN domain-containing protein 12-like isoform X1 [Bombyx mandarina]|uniref:Zinc finger and SCAN domain-containing protein 12-like isoform X1 n=1 Tax=Bombyx mandarina TaxID=7092 RepID=A0A6J2JGR6_BOMMA|nr:zinc finger and SCAN domain-containing protein 12-like isoform X1 [Bombyx mandarina]